MWQKNGRKVNTYLDRQAVSLKIDTMVSTQWHPFVAAYTPSRSNSLPVVLPILSDMKVARRESSSCTSVKKVTAAILLSFLTFGSPAVVSAADKVERNEAQHVLQVPELGDAPLQSHAESDFRRFVRHALPLNGLRCLISTSTRL
jgi:hypothetical protein